MWRGLKWWHIARKTFRLPSEDVSPQTKCSACFVYVLFICVFEALRVGGSIVHYVAIKCIYPSLESLSRIKPRICLCCQFNCLTLSLRRDRLADPGDNSSTLDNQEMLG